MRRHGSAISRRGNDRFQTGIGQPAGIKKKHVTLQVERVRRPDSKHLYAGGLTKAAPWNSIQLSNTRIAATTPATGPSTALRMTELK